MTTTEKKLPTLTGSQDLLTYFKLIPIYNKVVKPYPPENRTEGLDQTLFPYVSDLPGKMDTEFDGYIMSLLRDPQAVENGEEIKPLDEETLKDAFSLKEGPIPGFDASILGTDDQPNMVGSSSQYIGGGESSHKSTVGEYDHNGERKHKKKKKKRKHDHEHNEDGHSHSDHKKKKKKKKDRERRDEFEDVVVD